MTWHGTHHLVGNGPSLIPKSRRHLFKLFYRIFSREPMFDCPTSPTRSSRTRSIGRSSNISNTDNRFLMDAYLLSHALSGNEEDADSTLTSYLPTRLETKPRRLLLQLAKTSFPLASPTHLRLSSAALLHHSYIAFTRPGLLEHIKAASGRSTPELDKRMSIDWLETWAENGKEVRKVLWHAGVLNALLADFPQG